MQIREYLNINNMTIGDLARIIDVTQCYLWQVMSHRANPSSQLAKTICDLSKGKIQVWEIRRCTKYCEANCECSKGEK